jgi:hypothetical protein
MYHAGRALEHETGSGNIVTRVAVGTCGMNLNPLSAYGDRREPGAARSGRLRRRLARPAEAMKADIRAKVRTSLKGDAL